MLLTAWWNNVRNQMSQIVVSLFAADPPFCLQYDCHISKHMLSTHDFSVEDMKLDKLNSSGKICEMLV